MSIPFITINAANEKGDVQYTVTEEARLFLSQFHQKLTITSCTGPYRGGKSYLLSRLSQNENTFPKSSSTQPHTRGLHLSTKPIAGDHLFIDTEGFGSCVSGNMQTDVAIFALAILLSSKVIFNSSGKIDANTLDILECAVEAAKKLSYAAENQDALTIKENKPHLLYLIRNMNLSLQDEHKKQITPIQYLEDCISKYSRGKELSEALALLFCERSCITMCTPCLDIDMAEMKNLHDRFEQDYRRVENNVFAHTVSKKIAGCEMNGPVVLALAESLCAALSKGGIIKLDGIMATAKAAATAEMRFKNVNDFTTALHAKFSPQPKMSFWKVEILQAQIMDALRKWKQQNGASNMDDLLTLLDAYFQTACNANQLKMEDWKKQLHDAIGEGDENNDDDTDFDISHLLPSELHVVFDTLLKKCELSKEYVECNRKLTKQFEDTKHELHQLKETHVALQKAKEVLIEEKTTLEDQLDECTTKLANANETLEFAETNNAPKEELLEYERNLTKAQNEIRRLQLEMDNLLAENNDYQEAYTTKQTMLEREIRTQKELIQTLTATVQSTQQQLTECSQTLKQRTNEWKTAVKDKDRLTAEKDASHKRQKIAEEKCVSSGAKIAQLNAENEGLYKQIADLQTNLSHVTSKNRKLSFQMNLTRTDK